MTTYKVYETACHPNKWKVAAALWAKGTFYETREKAQAEADRLNKIEKYVYGNKKEAPSG